ncbi:hypothetical protein TKK_0008592 [Trichogramma kaykai]|uniref:TNase-like domain-containing protein n=1 Tax=Trichogramma kaykai TaxID=54128 RepID=A0ABD2X5L4_9HYME
MEEDEGVNILESFSDFMERDTRGEEILTYGIAGIALLTAMYKIRPFAKFKKPSDVPKHFFTKKVQLEGTVKNIEPSMEPYLLVDHKPLVPLPRLGPPKYLPVKIAGVNVQGNGLSWLQAVVKDKKIKFIPVKKDNQFLTCIVIVPQNNKEPISVGKELLRVGFGTVEDLKGVTSKDHDILNYLKTLKSAQKWAEKQRNGIWFYKYPPTFYWKLKINIDNKLKSLIPVSVANYFNL